MNKKPEIRNIPVFMIEVKKDPNTSTFDGEYRECLEFFLPYNGKRDRRFRMSLSPSMIAYIRERLDLAEQNIRQRMERNFND